MARKGKGLIALRRGHESNVEVSPRIKTPRGSGSVSRAPLQQSMHNNLAITMHGGRDNFPLWQ